MKIAAEMPRLKGYRFASCSMVSGEGVVFWGFDAFMATRIDRVSHMSSDALAATRQQIINRMSGG
jgi:hypothetical protein